MWLSIIIFYALLCLAYSDLAVVELVPIIVECFPDGFIISQCYEGKASILLRLSIFRESYTGDPSTVREQFAQILLRAAERQVAHIHSVLLNQAKRALQRFRVQVRPVQPFQDPHLPLEILLLDLNCLLHLRVVDVHLVGAG